MLMSNDITERLIPPPRHIFFLRKILVGAALILPVLATGTIASAQLRLPGQPVRTAIGDVRDFKRDYYYDKPYRYSPADPFQRGKFFQFHTGHSGFFYNCDNEEQKRCSPYICWKVHHEEDFPPHKRFGRALREDWAEVKQRIFDGSCGSCGNPDCTNPGCTGGCIQSAPYFVADGQSTNIDAATVNSTRMAQQTGTSQTGNFVVPPTNQAIPEYRYAGTRNDPGANANGFVDASRESSDGLSYGLIRQTRVTQPVQQSGVGNQRSTMLSGLQPRSESSMAPATGVAPLSQANNDFVRPVQTEAPVDRLTNRLYVPSGTRFQSESNTTRSASNRTGSRR